MAVIVYGDFNCPYSYLASQRVDSLARLGIAEVDWRAVEHDPGLPHFGRPADADSERWAAELADVAGRALPGEDVPGSPPAMVSNTAAAVAAYAEAVSDGVQDELRRSLFQAIWAEGRHISSATEVKRLVSAIMAPAVPILPHLASPDLSLPILAEPDPEKVVRLEGGTIALDGGPLTTAGHRRIRQWRREWQCLPAQVIPALVAPDGSVHLGTAALEYLASLLSLTRATQTVPGEGTRARTEAGASRSLQAAGAL
jgi:DSBA-like thioredoxin domain